MMSGKWFASGLFLVCVVAFEVGFAQSGGSGLTIEGTITDTAGRPVADVTVDLWQHGRRTSARSKADGSYSVAFKRGRPVSAVFYSKTGFHPTAIVEDLAGDESHEIHKTIRDVTERPRGKPRAPVHEEVSELLDQLHTYELIALLPLHADNDARLAATDFKFQQAKNCLAWLQETADDERLGSLLASYKADGTLVDTGLRPETLDRYLRERISLVELLYRPE